MLNDALSIVSWRSRPRSFVALMSLYESNYLRLASLAGNLRELADVRVSRVPDDCELRLSVTERSPYTTSFDFTYLFEEAQGVSTYPDMRVRIYHDAHLVEAQPWNSVHSQRAAPCGTHPQRLPRAQRASPERELDQRWARNMMLNKWLEYCVERGHRFSSRTEQRAGA